jgi:hypothetical protein
MPLLWPLGPSWRLAGDTGLTGSACPSPSQSACQTRSHLWVPTPARFRGGNGLTGSEGVSSAPPSTAGVAPTVPACVPPDRAQARCREGWADQSSAYVFSDHGVTFSVPRRG